MSCKCRCRDKNDNSPGTVHPYPGKVPPGNPNTYLYTYCNQPFPYPFLVQPLPPPRREAEDTGGFCTTSRVFTTRLVAVSSWTGSTYASSNCARYASR
jgi:hypothetical protein